MNLCFSSECPESTEIPKGKSLISFPSDYVVLDLETTGLSPEYDEIIEIACVRVRDHKVTDTFSTLVKPINEIDSFITELTGITNEMVSNAPTLKEALPNAIDFISKDIVLGWNVNFDIKFLALNSYYQLQKPFINDFVDGMRIARRLYPDLQHHRLSDMVDFLGVELKAHHRATEDCLATFNCFEKMQNAVLEKYPSHEDFIKTVSYSKKGLDARTLSTDKTEFDSTHPLYGKICVFTGTLDRMERKAAMQIVLDLGGQCANGITKKTNFLVLGNNDYRSSIKDGKSNKQKKAEEYRLNGCDIEIIPEDVFYDMIQE